MINILSKDTINKIAAGEVVERPASVVKELLENSLDAGATKIILKVSKGGLEKISIEDNGVGIEQADLSKLFYIHATSKIANINDLNNIKSFGFRGEALASIASVADVTLTTRSIKDEEGSIIKVRNAKSTITTEAFNKGTLIQVENLFYNVPARRKFMKSEKTEFMHILKVFQEIALVNPLVRLILYTNNKVYLKYESEDIEGRIKKIIKWDLLDYSTIYSSSVLDIKGSFVKPGVLLSNTDQYIFVNNRSINSPLISKAVKEAYRSYLKKDLRPAFAIFIGISPELIDVNVHPRKTEIRFQDQSTIYTAVYRGCMEYLEKQGNSIQSLISQDIADLNGEVEYKNDNPKGQQYSYSFDKGSLKHFNKTEYQERPQKEDIGNSLDFTKFILETSESKSAENYGLEGKSLDLKNKEYIQIDNKFIVFSTNEGINIIDQHAASERINYEKYIEDFKLKKYDFHIALFPVNIELGTADYLYTLEHKEVFKKFGMMIEDLGNDLLSITHFSSRIPVNEASRIFYDILNNLKEGVSEDAEFEKKLIASISCRTAIMFGQKLAKEEIIKLMKDLYSCKSPFTCAHGRPLKYVIPYSEILKKLSRC